MFQPSAAQGSSATAPVAVPAVASYSAQALQLHALQERRDAISQQYQTVMAERGRISQERLNAEARGDAAMVREYDGTIARLGSRLKELEATKQAFDEQIEKALKGPVEISTVPAAVGDQFAAVATVPSFDQSVQELLRAQKAEFQRYMVFEGAILLLLAVVVARLGTLRGRLTATREWLARGGAPRDNDRLQNAVDAIAIEVERLSEAQRFQNALLNSRQSERDAVPLMSRKGTTPTDGTRITPH